MCKLCETKSVYEFTNKRKLCARCFINYFQKKVLYTIRKFKMIKNGDVIGYENDGSFCEVVLEDVLKMYVEKGDVELRKIGSLQSRSQINGSELALPSSSLKKLLRNKKISKVAVESTIDLEAVKIINEIINGNQKNLQKFKPIDENIIKPLYLFLDEEVLLYAKLRKLKFNKKKEKEDRISEFLDELEKKHPEVKRAIVNGYLSLAQ